jgi:predicted metal-binding protein
MSIEQADAIAAVLEAGPLELERAQQRLREAFKCRVCNGVGRYWNCPPLVRGGRTPIASIEPCRTCRGLGAAVGDGP